MKFCWHDWREVKITDLPNYQRIDRHISAFISWWDKQTDPREAVGAIWG